MKKNIRYVSFGAFLGVAILVGALLRKEDASRRLANARSDTQHRRNVELLRSIPLVTGLENPSRGERNMARDLIEIFNKIENEGKGSDEALNRGTHSKGSCFAGEFTILGSDELKSQFRYPDETINRLKKGIFSLNGAFPADVRFANAMGAKHPDTLGDVRGLSFSVSGLDAFQNFTGDGRQDFMMNSTPMFAVNNIQEFLALMKAARLAQGDFSYFLNPFYLPAVLKAKKLLDHYQTNDTRSYATEEYWGNLPYTHGRAGANGIPDLVKFKATPCNGSGIQRESSQSKADDYLQKDITERVSAGSGVCFLVQAQFFDLDKLSHTGAGWSTASEWVENGGELWDEAILPFYTVAKLEVKRRGTDCGTQFFNTRLHSNIENLPVGSIARVRTFIEENSRARRMGEIP